MGLVTVDCSRAAPSLRVAPMGTRRTPAPLRGLLLALSTAATALAAGACASGASGPAATAAETEGRGSSALQRGNIEGPIDDNLVCDQPYRCEASHVTRRVKEAVELRGTPVRDVSALASAKKLRFLALPKDVYEPSVDVVRSAVKELRVEVE